jgi:hypothetical protein
MSKFLHCIHTCSLKKFCKLRAYSLYTEKISVVSPFKDKFARNLSLSLKSLTAGWSCTFFKKLGS